MGIIRTPKTAPKAPVATNRNAAASVAKAVSAPVPQVKGQPVRKPEPKAPAVGTPTAPAPVSKMVQGGMPAKGAVIHKATTEAPHRKDTHAPAPEAVQTAVKLSKEAVQARDKGERAKLVAKLSAGEKPIRGQLTGLNAQELTAIAKGRGLRGYSALKKDELVEFILAGGVKPQAAAGSARDLRETAADLKRQGLISGPVSALKVDALRSAVASAQQGKAVTVSKPTPNSGTADHCKMLLREGLAKGYSARATAMSKEMFSSSISTLKAQQLRDLVAALGL